jgi:hypothetical protein
MFPVDRESPAQLRHRPAPPLGSIRVQVLSVAWICEIAAVKVCPDGAMSTRRILATRLRATSIYVDRLANSRHCVGSATDRHARTVTGGRQPRLGRQIIASQSVDVALSKKQNSIGRTPWPDAIARPAYLLLTGTMLASWPVLAADVTPERLFFGFFSQLR